MKDYGIEYNGGDLCRFFNGIKSLVIFSLRSVSTNAPMKHYCKELNIFSFFREGFYFLSLSLSKELFFKKGQMLITLFAQVNYIVYLCALL